jgi:hypothetical protein
LSLASNAFRFVCAQSSNWLPLLIQAAARKRRLDQAGPLSFKAVDVRRKGNAAEILCSARKLVRRKRQVS